MSLTSWAELIAGGLIVGGIYALVAIGLNLQYGLMRILNIAHGEFLMVGAFLTWWAHAALGWSPLASLPIVFLALLTAGMAIHALCFKRLARISANVETFEARGLIVCFGLMFLVQNLALIVWGGDLRGYDYMSASVQVGGLRITQNRLLIFAVAISLSIGSILLLRTTMLGKSVRALMQAPIGARLVGINTKRLHPFIFGVGLGLSGVAGALLSTAYEISPSIGEPYTITALIVMTLGGFGSVLGSLVGGLLLGVVETTGTYYTNPSMKMLLSYSIFIGVLLWKPNGLFAK